MNRERPQASADRRVADLASRFDLLGRLAVGGMAELFVGRNKGAPPSSRVVVIKRILPQLAEDPEFVRMFRDEAYLASTLDHPNIVKVFEVGLDEDEPYFTMEYVHGENLRTIIRGAQARNEGIPLDVVLAISLGVTASLHYAHERTDANGKPLMIVHRDVSPTNVLVSQQGEVKIVDFGIAKAAAGTHVTQAGMLKGKASYMSPEQCRAEHVDRRSDVFAIGILLYELTTLQRLFRGENELTILHQILTGNIPPPSTVVPTFPRELEAILMRALQIDPAQRYPTAAAMQQDLEGFVGRHGLRPSADVLSRYLVERFGAKPVPWAQQQQQQQQAVEPARGDEAPTTATPGSDARARAPAAAAARGNQQGVRPAAAPRVANAGVAPKRPPTGASPAASREPARMPARPVASAADPPPPRSPTPPPIATPREPSRAVPVATAPRPSAPAPAAAPRAPSPASQRPTMVPTAEPARRPAVPIATTTSPQRSSPTPAPRPVPMPSAPMPAASAPTPAASAPMQAPPMPAQSSRTVTPEQAAFLRGEAPPGVSFTAGANDPRMASTELARTMPGTEPAVPSAQNFDDSQAHTAIANPPPGTQAHTVFAAATAPSHTQIAPAPAGLPMQAMHTQIAPAPAGAPSHTQIAPAPAGAPIHTPQRVAPPMSRTMVPSGPPPPASPPPPAASTNPPPSAPRTVFLGEGAAPPPREDRTMIAPPERADATMIAPASLPPSGVDRTMIAPVDAAAIAALAAAARAASAPAAVGAPPLPPSAPQTSAPAVHRAAAPPIPPPPMPPPQMPASASAPGLASISSPSLSSPAMSSPSMRAPVPTTGTQPMPVSRGGTGVTNVGLDPPPRKPWLWIVIAMLGLGMVGAAAVVAWPRVVAWRAAKDTAEAASSSAAVASSETPAEDAKADGAPPAEGDEAKVDDAKADDAKADESRVDDAKVDEAKAEGGEVPVAEPTPDTPTPTPDTPTPTPDAPTPTPDTPTPTPDTPTPTPDTPTPEPVTPKPTPKAKPSKPKPSTPKPAKPSKPATPKKPKKPGTTPIPGFGHGPLVPP